MNDLFSAQPVSAAALEETTLAVDPPAGGDAPVGEVYFLLSDHLGSTTITLNIDGSVKSEMRYDAWGKTRYTSGTTPTERHYTGQIEESGFGLYFYNARWYDSSLGRFIQADTIIPQPGNPLAWDRYSYTSNSPVNYGDPTGHAQACAVGDLGAGCGSDGTIYYILDKYIEKRESGLTYTWYGLPEIERKALENQDWNADIWEDAIGGPGVTAADPLHDPAVWITSLFGLGRLTTVGITNAMKAAGPAITYCATSGNCGNVQSQWPGTIIPKSYTLTVGNNQFWVHPNATEHMMQLATRNPYNVFNPAANTILAQEMIISSFESAVNSAVAQGIQYGQIIQSGGWELIFGPPNQPGLLPVIFHALFRN